MNDEDIVKLYWARDEQAIQETGKAYGAYCGKIARNILHNNEDVDECLSDTWLKAWNTIPPTKPMRLQMYLGKIVRNLALDRYKLYTAEKRGGGELALALEELNECADSRYNIESEVEGKELGRIINEFAHGLSERECNLFLRRYYYIESISEIGKRYGMTKGSVSASLSRIRGKLKAYLEKEEYYG